MFTDYEPDQPVWVKVTAEHRVMGRVVETYRSDGSRPSVLVRMGEDCGAYRKGSVVAFSYLKLRWRNVDHRREREAWLTRLARRVRRS